jgi:GTP cyclohydrolase IA
MKSQDVIRLLIERIGDDPERPGLVDTPGRVMKSWDELFCGYHVDVPAIFKVFDDHERYDGIVLCRRIEFVSFCEHHMLPFTGFAHVAYIPGSLPTARRAMARGEAVPIGALSETPKVVGLSKLARLVDAYARRLQMQERIGQQVVQALDEHLNPEGAACIIEAKHMCMSCRGVMKQSSSMVTSSLSGAFLHESSARAELMSLIAL